MSESVDAESGEDVPQGPDWAARSKRRLRAVLEILAGNSAPIKVQELREAVIKRVPLASYDLTTTSTGSTRWTNRLFWYTSTGYTHSGFLHATMSGYRITAQGRQALERFPTAEDLFDAAGEGYQAWDLARKEELDEPHLDPGSQIIHGGNAASHAFRAVGPILHAWRAGDSAFQPGTAVWSPETTAALFTFLRGSSSRLRPELPGLKSDPARILAAESLSLLLAPMHDMPGSTKRTRIRNPMLSTVDDPPALPIQLSADLDFGLVRGGKAFGSDPVALLRSFVMLLGQWWSLRDPTRDMSLNGPWQFRDALTGLAGVDERVSSLVNLVVHPGSFTTLPRSQDRADVVRAFGDRLADPSGDIDRDLKSIVIALQAENGGHGVDLQAPPLVSAWSGATDNESAWLIRGQVEQQDWVEVWRERGIVTLNAGRFRHLPADANQGTLSSMVEDLYSDLSPVEREAKRRDVLNFVLAIRPGDLVVTDDGGNLRLGRVADEDVALESAGGSIMLTRPVIWSADASDRITELPTALSRRLRFKGEDVVNLSELIEQLEIYEIDEARGPGTGNRGCFHR